MYDNREKIMNRLEEHLAAVIDGGYEWVGIFLQGSFNYGLQYEGSDVDTKAIVLPKFEDFVLNKSPKSFTHVMPNNEHVDIKDIRLMFDCFKKQNINFVEILFSDYYIINEKYEELFRPMIENREMIARYNNFASVNCMVGAMMEKRKALQHPYPSIVWKIDKWGYDGKQLSHIIRYSEFLNNYIFGNKYKDCLIPSEDSRELQLKAKKNEIELEEAIRLADFYVADAKETKTVYMEKVPLIVNEEASVLMNNVIINIMKLNFQSELQKN